MPLNLDNPNDIARECPHCRKPAKNAGRRDGITFFKCEHCGTAGADAPGKPAEPFREGPRQPRR